MDRSAASAYVYAKASGMLAKSFVGSRAEKLFSVKSLRELYGLLFDDEVPAIPEPMLAKVIETKAQKYFVAQYTGLLENYSEPDEVLIRLASPVLPIVIQPVEGDSFLFLILPVKLK